MHYKTILSVLFLFFLFPGGAEAQLQTLLPELETIPKLLSFEDEECILPDGQHIRKGVLAVMACAYGNIVLSLGERALEACCGDSANDSNCSMCQYWYDRHEDYLYRKCEGRVEPTCGVSLGIIGWSRSAEGRFTRRMIACGFEPSSEPIEDNEVSIP